MSAGPDPLVVHQQTLYRSRNPTRRWLHRSRRNLIVSALRRHPPRDRATARGLEIGPGSCTYLPTLLELCGRVVAADIEQAYLHEATRLAAGEQRLVAIVDDICATRLDAASFDLILCTEVIEHVPDSLPALRAIRGLLKPDGVLILSTPQRWSLVELCARVATLPGIIHLTRAIYGESVVDLGHINLLTAAALRAQLDAAGLVITDHWVSGFYLPALAEFGGICGRRFLQRWQRRLAGTRLSALFWTQFYVVHPGIAPAGRPSSH